MHDKFVEPPPVNEVAERQAEERRPAVIVALEGQDNNREFRERGGKPRTPQKRVRLQVQRQLFDPKCLVAHTLQEMLSIDAIWHTRA